MNKLICSSFFTLIAIVSLGQSNNQLKTFEGFYRGDNLKIQCRQSPITPWSTCDCIDSVVINSHRLSRIEIEEQELTINIDKNLVFFEKIEIKISYQNNCELRILNPNQFFPKEILPVADVRIDSTNTLHWRSLQNYPDIRLWTQVEQKKWGDWIKIGPNFNIQKEDEFEFNLSPYLNKGSNEFRVVVATIDYDHYPSDSKSIDIKKKKAKAKYKKKKAKVILNNEFHFEFYNSRMEIIQRGFGNEIDTRNQSEGEYIIRYADRIFEFKIK